MTRPHVYVNKKHFYAGDIFRSSLNGNLYEVMHGCNGMQLQCISTQSDEYYAINEENTKRLSLQRDSLSDKRRKEYR